MNWPGRERWKRQLKAGRTQQLNLFVLCIVSSATFHLHSTSFRKRSHSTACVLVMSGIKINRANMPVKCRDSRLTLEKLCRPISERSLPALPSSNSFVAVMCAQIWLQKSLNKSHERESTPFISKLNCLAADEWWWTKRQAIQWKIHKNFK